ncbi:unnamed protein product [Ectocarpus sp. 12 AP-2014]
MPPPLLAEPIPRRQHDTSPSFMTCCWLTDAPTISIQNNAKKHHFGHIFYARMLERCCECHLSPLPEPPRDVSTPIRQTLRHVWLVQQPCPIARSTVTQTTATSTCWRSIQQTTSPTHPPRSSHIPSAGHRTRAAVQRHANNLCTQRVRWFPFASESRVS